MADEARKRRHVGLIRVVVGVALVAAASWATPGEIARAAQSAYFLDLSMENVIPAPEGDVASGSGELTIDPAAGSICWNIHADTSSETPTIELRAGGAGTNGELVFDFGTMTSEGQAVGCRTGESAVTLDAIVAAPDQFYLLVGTETTPTGVLRAQLEPLVLSAQVMVVTRLCPKAIQTVAQFNAAPANTCPSATRVGDAPSVPDGYSIIGWAGSWSFNYQTKTIGDTQASLADASPAHWGFCSDAEQSCTFEAMSYAWEVESTTNRTVRATTVPSGHRVGLVRAFPLGGEDPIATSYSPTTRTATFDLTGAGGDVMVEFVYFVSDTTAPALGTPRTTFRSGAISAGGSIPLAVAWTGSDTGSGIARYQIQRRVDGGAWTTLSSSVPGAYFSTAGSTGHSYQYRVRGIDRVGNVSAWVTGPTRTVTSVSDASSAISYSGTWTKLTSPSAYGGTLRRASSSTARATVTRTAMSFAVIARKTPGAGRFRVYADGALKATIDLDGASAWRVVAWRGSWPSVGSHRVQIRPAGDGPIYFDGFVTLR